VLNREWFSEFTEGDGLATSLKLRRKLHEERTPHQHIAVYETETFGNLLLLDGIIMLTARDNYVYHEMMTHTPLFSHPAPRDVLIAGGGDCGSLREIAKHREVASIAQVELDERVVRAAERFFPELCAANGDPRVRMIFDDAVAWLARTGERTLDVLVLDTPDPVGPARRLFSEPFYRDCLRALRPGGILTAQTESPLLDLDFLRQTQDALRRAGFAEVRTVLFPACSYPSGWWTASMARKGRPFDGFREQDAREKEFPTSYYNADIHAASQVLPETLREALAPAAPAP